MSQLKQKYGFFTAASMVVGIVIGSGVFKSAGSVLQAAGGNQTIAIAAWLIGGLIMIASAYSFSLISVEIKEITGVVDYIEVVAGKKMGYIVEWFMTYIYYPALVSILAWLAGSITVSIFDLGDTFNGTNVWLFGIAYAVITYVLSFVSPVLAGKWQVSATVIKLMPLALLAIGGLFYGLFAGNTVENFTTVATSASSGSLVKAVAITVFAYDGWVLATSISKELKDPKKNLPRALVFGSLLVVGAYLLFFVGLSGILTNEETISLAGSLDTTVVASKRLFGNVFGSLVSILVLCSVLGTLNGVLMASMRGMHTISSKGKGPKPELFSRVSRYDVPYVSGIVSVVFTIFWYGVWYGNFNGWFNGFIDTSVLAIIFLYTFYILVYVYVVAKMKHLSFIKRFVVPVVAIGGSLYLVYGAFISDPRMFVYFFCIVFVITFIGYTSYETSNK